MNQCASCHRSYEPTISAIHRDCLTHEILLPDFVILERLQRRFHIPPDSTPSNSSALLQLFLGLIKTLQQDIPLLLETSRHHVRTGPHQHVIQLANSTRPRINVLVPQTDQFLSFEVGSDLTINDLKEFITAETSIPASAQILSVNGRPLTNNSQTLQAAGIQDDDMLAVAARQPQQPQRQPAPASSNQAPSENQQIEQARQQILGQPQHLERLRNQTPELANAINDPTRFRELFLASRRAQEAQLRTEQQRLARLDDDVNEENQEEIYKRIQQQNIEAEYERTMEENPECTSSPLPRLLPLT